MCKFKKLILLLPLILAIFIIPPYISAKKPKKSIKYNQNNIFFEPQVHIQNNILSKRQKRRHRHKEIQRLKAARFHRNTYDQPIVDLRGLKPKDAASLVQSIASNSHETLTFITGNKKYSPNGHSVLKQTVVETSERIKWICLPHRFNNGRMLLIHPSKLPDSNIPYIGIPG